MTLVSGYPLWHLSIDDNMDVHKDVRYQVKHRLHMPWTPSDSLSQNSWDIALLMLVRCARFGALTAIKNIGRTRRPARGDKKKKKKKQRLGGSVPTIFVWDCSIVMPGHYKKIMPGDYKITANQSARTIELWGRPLNMATGRLTFIYCVFYHRRVKSIFNRQKLTRKRK